MKKLSLTPDGDTVPSADLGEDGHGEAETVCEGRTRHYEA